MIEENPFQSPGIEVEVVSRDDIFLDYAEAYRYVFRNPKWLVNSLLMGVVQIIPIVGMIVVLGYQFEVAIALLQRPGQTYPDFDFNRFGDYLQRGLWPFLVVLLWSMIFGVLFFLVMMVIVLVVALLNSGASQAEAELIASVVFGSSFLIWMGAGLLMQVFMMPLMLRSALERDFMKGMSLGFALQFVGNTWRESFVVTCLVYLTMLVALAVGMLLFCVGHYFTLGLVILVQVHFFVQLYRIHCRRGGQLIHIAP